MVVSQHMGILTIAGVCVHLVPFYNAVRAVTNMFIRSPQNILRCLCEIGPSWDADCQRWTMSFHRLTSFPFTLCQPNRTIDLDFRGALLGPKKWINLNPRSTKKKHNICCSYCWLNVQFSKWWSVIHGWWWGALSSPSTSCVSQKNVTFGRWCIDRGWRIREKPSLSASQLDQAGLPCELLGQHWFPLRSECWKSKRSINLDIEMQAGEK